MSNYTTKRLYVPPLLWLVALMILCHSRCVSAVRRHGSPMVMDPCSIKCQTAVLTPCIAKCGVDVECQQKCKEDFNKCLEECRAKIKKENKQD